MVAFDGKEAYHANVVLPCPPEELADVPEQLLTLIIALYFQSQQESYLRNNYNQHHPEEVLLDAFLNHHDVDVASELSEYEQARLARIKSNLDRVAELINNSG